jgi:predicted component of viral defense system (DUF524 family)
MTGQNFFAGDMVYYLHTNQMGVRVKFAAVVLGLGTDGVTIRVGRYDVHSKEVSSFETTVAETSLQARTVPCSYEDELIK